MPLRAFPAGLIRTPFVTAQGWLHPRWQQFLQADVPLTQGGFVHGPVVDPVTGHWSDMGVNYIQWLLGSQIPTGLLGTPVVTKQYALTRAWQQYFGSQL